MRAAAAARQDATEVAQAAIPERPLAQLHALHSRIGAALEADRHSSGGFGVGFDLPASSRGWVIVVVPTGDVSEGQRALAERLRKEFGGQAVIWRGGSGSSWQTIEVDDSPGPVWSGSWLPAPWR